MVVVFAIVTGVTKLSVELSHLTMLPVCPASVKVPELVPEQTAALVVTVPPTVTGSMVRLAATEFAEEQVPDWTTALYLVAVVKLV